MATINKSIIGVDRMTLCISSYVAPFMGESGFAVSAAQYRSLGLGNLINMDEILRIGLNDKSIMVTSLSYSLTFSVFASAADATHNIGYVVSLLTKQSRDNMTQNNTITSPGYYNEEERVVGGYDAALKSILSDNIFSSYTGNIPTVPATPASNFNSINFQSEDQSGIVFLGKNYGGWNMYSNGMLLNNMTSDITIKSLQQRIVLRCTII
jgi:hypothetical protein